MATALTLEQYLDRSGSPYEVLPHAPTESSLRTAKASHVSANELAKAVVLKNKKGYLLAVLPASQHLEFKALGKWLNQNLALATEDEIAWLFPDCTPGAVPPIGEATGSRPSSTTASPSSPTSISKAAITPPSSTWPAPSSAG
jgi:Ala-tRNA(Pro) deacylase